MKIFYITANFKLTKKPSWLDKFRKKYDDPYEYHITLKQATYLEDKDQPDLQKKLSTITSRFSPITIICNKLKISKTPKGYTIMIEATNNPKLNQLQNEIHHHLSVFGEIIKDHYKKFEESFDPHITIGRHLSDDTLELAKKELQSNTHCEATITKITLNINEATANPNLIQAEYTKHFPLDENTIAVKVDLNNWVKNSQGIAAAAWKNIDTTKYLKKLRDEWNEK